MVKPHRDASADFKEKLQHREIPEVVRVLPSTVLNDLNKKL
jgi:hypothetical protein